MNNWKLRRTIAAVAAPIALLTVFAPTATADIEATGNWSVHTQRDTVTVKVSYHRAPDNDHPYRCWAEFLTARRFTMSWLTYDTYVFRDVPPGSHTISATCEDEDRDQVDIGTIRISMPGPEHRHFAGSNHFVIG